MDISRLINDEVTERHFYQAATLLEVYFEATEGRNAVMNFEEANYLYSELYSNFQIGDVLEFLGLDPIQSTVIDSNLFVAIGTAHSENYNDSSECVARCAARCTRCKVVKPSYCFNCPSEYISTRCNICRGTEFYNHENIVNYIIDLSLLENSVDKLKFITELHNERFLISKNFDLGIHGLVTCIRSDFLNIAEGQGFETKLSGTFIDAIEKIESYKYRKNGGTSTMKKYWCSQRTRTKSKNSEAARIRDSKKCFECCGAITISILQNVIKLRIKHRYHHDSPLSSISLSSISRDRINSLSEGGLTPFQILGVLRAESTETFIYNQVYNVWADAISCKFRLHQDPVKSLELYLQKEDSLSVIYQQEKPFGIGFITNIGMDIACNWRIEEILIDSTHKTNKQKLELFAIITSCMGAGFPLGYFFLEAGTSNGLKPREVSITGFLQSVRNKIPTLKPSFFLQIRNRVRFQQ